MVVDGERRREDPGRCRSSACGQMFEIMHSYLNSGIGCWASAALLCFALLCIDPLQLALPCPALQEDECNRYECARYDVEDLHHGKSIHSRPTAPSATGASSSPKFVFDANRRSRAGLH